MSANIPATVTILTKNSGKTLQRALESVRDFDEIVICDGGSTDETLSIAGAVGARVILQEAQFLDAKGKIYDYSGVRNQTLDAARHNWIFWLDSDEYVGADLIESIRKIISTRGAEGTGAFWVNRKYVIDGEVIDCAATYPNRQMRFFSKNSTSGMVKKVHERIKLTDGVKAEFLFGTMLIPFEADVEVIRRKWDYQIAVAAAQSSPMAFSTFLVSVFEASKVSALWLFRLFRNAISCSGSKMPLRFEMERHYFHIRLLRALWHEVRF